MSSLPPFSPVAMTYGIEPMVNTSAAAEAGAGASLSRSSSLGAVTAISDDSPLTLGENRYRFRNYANERELTEQRMHDLTLGFRSLDSLNDEALILYREEEVLINLYSTTIEIPGVSHPCTLISYVLPRPLFESLQRGLEKQFLHQGVLTPQVLTLSCLTLIQEILVAREHLSCSAYIADQLELLTLHLSSWLGWMELSRMRVDRAKAYSQDGVDAVVHQIMEEERVIQAAGEGASHIELSDFPHRANSTLFYMCKELQACADRLAVPFRPSPPKRESLSTKALAAQQRSQEEILKPLQKLRLDLKQTVEAAIWMGSSPKHSSLLLCLSLLHIFAAKEKDGRTLLIDSVEKLDGMLEVRAKMHMGKVKRANDLNSYIHAFRKEIESCSMPLSPLKREKEAHFPMMISLGFALEKRYRGVLLPQAMGLENYLVRIDSTAAASEESPFLALACSPDFDALPLYKCRALLMSQALSLYEMNEARQFNKMHLTAVDATTLKLRMHSTLGSIGWLEIWKEMPVHEIPLASDLPRSVSSFLQSTQALLRKLPSIDDSRIDQQLNFLYRAQEALLKYEPGAINLIYDYLVGFHEIEALYLWTCAMSQHCILSLNAIKKNGAMSYEEIDELIFSIESHRVMDLLKVSESLIECYRSFIPLIVAPTYMADAFITLLVELRETRRLKAPEELAEATPTRSVAIDATQAPPEVVPDRAVIDLIADIDAEPEATDAPLDPAIIEALANVMSGPSYYTASPLPIAPEGLTGAGAGAGAGAGEEAAPISERPSLINDIQLKSIKDHRHLHRFLHAAGMQCLRENGGSHSTWGAAGVKFTVACHRKQEVSPKIRQRIMDAVKSAHEAIQREAQEQSRNELAAERAKKPNGRRRK